MIQRFFTYSYKNFIFSSFICKNNVQNKIEMMQDVTNCYRLIMVDHGIQKWKMAHMSLSRHL